VHYLKFLDRVHRLLRPPTYLEIGVRHGHSLALARCRSVGIDPAYRLRVPLGADSTLFRERSDEYFARPDPLEPFGGRWISLAFIDGMHLLEYALRDFINVERHTHWTSVVAFDDVLPRNETEAQRDRTTRAWAGDVYKIAAILTRYRPDLTCLRVATAPTGVLLILGLDRDSTVLADNYERILDTAVRAAPQPVPTAVLDRRDALDPEAVLSASFWSTLRDGRNRDSLRAALDHDFGARPGATTPSMGGA
jgi:hypothetical protein